MIWKRRLLSFGAVLLVLPLLRGAEPVNDAPRPHVTVPKTSSPPALTASPDDPAWAGAVRLPMNFSIYWGKPPPPSGFRETEVLLLWDPDFLYVRFLCRDDDVYLPVHGRDAPIYQGDAAEIFLDPVGDSRQWIELEFNATNDVFDQIFFCTGEPKSDPALLLTDEVVNRDVWALPEWNLEGLKSAAAYWVEGGKRVGWIVDAAIPASGILKRRGETHFGPMTLRGDFLRYKWLPGADPKKRELISLNWSPVVCGCPHHSPAAYGYITLSDGTAH